MISPHTCQALNDLPQSATLIKVSLRRPPVHVDLRTEEMLLLFSSPADEGVLITSQSAFSSLTQAGSRLDLARCTLSLCIILPPTLLTNSSHERGKVRMEGGGWGGGVATAAPAAAFQKLHWSINFSERSLGAGLLVGSTELAGLSREPLALCSCRSSLTSEPRLLLSLIQAQSFVDDHNPTAEPKTPCGNDQTLTCHAEQ